MDIQALEREFDIKPTTFERWTATTQTLSTLNRQRRSIVVGINRERRTEQESDTMPATVLRYLEML